jgi:hypothetical protein
MEGRTHIVCGDCGRTCDVAGEMPEEYRGAFLACIYREGWVPRPGVRLALICGECARKYEGSETRDDAEKIY